MGRFLKTTMLICACYMSAAMLINPTACIEAAGDALNLCAQVVIPSLFPFFVCSNLLIALGGARVLSRYLSKWMRPLFGISGSGALAVVLGVISGYPVGADCIAGLYRSACCTKTEAERMLTFCNNSGPLFVMGAVGIGMLGNQRLGILLYVIHVVSALLTGVLFRKYGKTTQKEVYRLPPATPLQPPVSAVGNAVADGVTSICKVCGFVVVFAVFTATFSDSGDSSLIYALLEITGGLKALLNTKMLGEYLLPAVSFFLAFSGVSVILQVAGIILSEGLSCKPYLLGKITHASLAFVMTAIVLRIFPQTQVVSLIIEPTSMLVPNPIGVLIMSFAMLFWSTLSLFLTILIVSFLERLDDRTKAGLGKEIFGILREKRRG